MQANPAPGLLLLTSGEYSAVRNRYTFLGLGVLIFFLLTACTKIEESNSPDVIAEECFIQGIVTDSVYPLPDALVRVRATDIFTRTDGNGKFTLLLPTQEEKVTVTAWAEGYYIGGGILCRPGDKDVNIVLTPYSDTDNKNYQWISSYSAAGDPMNCENCHSDPKGKINLPFDEWIMDAHSGSATNYRFLTMYTGTDIEGNQSPSTVYMNHPEYGAVPLLPDKQQSYYGPGYKLDFPRTAGNCAACHAPLGAIANPYGTDPSKLSLVEREGISCDFCHKILDVKLNINTAEPEQNMPGVLSYRFGRPREGHQLFTGPFDDVAPGEDVFSPLQRESRYCAACHLGSFWGVRIYNSYGEWLESPYSSEPNGKTCQECHMPSGSADHFARIEAGGCIRNPADIASHRMLGIRDHAFMQNSVSMEVNTGRRDTLVDIRVEINNDNTGHHIPTDSPMRHLILLVKATDSMGNALQQVEGPVLPEWCGTGERDEGYFGGLPGQVYAKILQEYWTEKVPSASYWMQTRIVSDNRIRAFEISGTAFSFLAPGDGSIHIEIKLIYRRAFIELADQKGWEKEDILLAHKSLEI